MATALYSTPPLADFVLSEATGQRSRDNVIVTQTGDAIPSGTVLSLVSGKYVPHEPAGADPETEPGTGPAVAVLYSHLLPATGDVTAVAFTAACEVKATALIGLVPAAIPQLLAAGIKVRTNATTFGIHTPAL